MRDNQAVLIAPSVLSADFANLQREIEMLNESEADWIHLDVMDGKFVPNISFGLPVCEAIQRHAQKPLDVHLMIEQPERYLEHFQKAGASVLTVHYEACIHLHRVIQQIKSLGCKAGVAINPHTPTSVLEEVIQDIDVVCLMSVNPGFAKQAFIAHSLDKIARLRTLIAVKRSEALIEIDGGVNGTNAASIISAGADILVAGSFVFNSEDAIQTIKELKDLGH